MMRPDLVDDLKQLMRSVRLELLGGPDAGWTIAWEKRVYPVASVPLTGIDDGAVRAELLAVAAGFEAAVKAPGRLVPGEGLREGARHLLPRVERSRFAEAYDAVIDGAGGDVSKKLLYQPFGGGLITTYVEDEGWKFVHMIRGRFDAWQTTIGTIHSVARSNLYHRAELDYRAREVQHGDGYDAGRAVLIDDVFYDRIGSDGAEIAVPGRDLLMVAPVGGRLSGDAVRQAFELAKYPISPEILVFRDGLVERRGGFFA